MKRTIDNNLLLTSSRFIKQREYWINKLSVGIGETGMLFPNKTNSGTGKDLKSVEIMMGDDLSGRLVKLSKDSDLSLYMVLLAGLKLLIYRYTGNSDINVISPVYQPNVTGDTFNDFLFIRDRVTGDLTFKELILRIRESVLEAYENQDFPFEKLMAFLWKTDREEDWGFRSKIECSLENIHDDRDIGDKVLNDRLVFSFERENQRVRGTIIYNPGIYEDYYIQQVAGHFVNILRNSIEDVNINISKVPLLSKQEKQRLLFDLNNTAAEYPKDKTLNGLFEEQARGAPHAVAVVGHSTGAVFPHAPGNRILHLTYGALNDLADRLARTLREKGAAPDVITAVMAERSIETLIGILAILKAGGAYLPIDPGHPQERVEYMLADSGAKILLSKMSEVSREVEVIELTKIRANEYENDPTRQIPPGQLTHPNQLCYVIYTSGSTGRPKGVLVEHSSAVNLILSQKNQFEVNETDRVLQFSSLSFDASVEQVFVAFSSGAVLILVDEDTLLDTVKFDAFIRRQTVTHLDAVPSFLSNILLREPHFYSLKRIVSGGEVCPVPLAEKLSRYCDFYNAYGPTETTVTAVGMKYQPGNGRLPGLPIGSPISNTQVYLFDRWKNPVPLAVPGELYIGGAGVTRGYLNRPELTSKKFLPHSLVDGNRMYRTGDLARWLPDGNIEFLGRSDQQVKIRGFRIEPGEIESQMLTHPQVKNAVVIARGTNEDRSLFAYYVNAIENQPELFPSIGEYPLYDELMYYTMTNDELRNKSYRIAINRLVKDKTVVEIGAGQDVILARFCIEAGAKKVYAIELSEESYKRARETLKKIGLEEKIILIHGDSLNIELPEKVDVCVSEIIGSIGGSEGAAAILNDARRFLKEDGIMIPGKCITKIAALRLPQCLQQRPGFSKIAAKYIEKLFDYFGYKFDFRLCVRRFPKSNIISNSEIFEALNFSGIIDESNSHEIKLVINRDTTLDGFLLWINLYTIEDELIDALENECNWLPVFVPLPFPGIDVSEGDMIAAECIRKRSANNVNPDYKIKGILTRKRGNNIELECDLPYFERGFQRTPYYKKVFDEQATSGIRYINKKIGAGELKEYLKKKLPGYMIPSSFMQIEGIPLTPNGKVNRKALPEPGIKPGEKYTAPANELEKKLVDIWSEVLGIDGEAIGINENFFDLGGNSIKVIQLNSKLKEIFKEDIHVLTMFKHTTIRSFIQHLKKEEPLKNLSSEDWFEAMDRGKNKSNRLKNKMRRPLRND